MPARRHGRSKKVLALLLAAFLIPKVVLPTGAVLCIEPCGDVAVTTPHDSQACHGSDTHGGHDHASHHDCGGDAHTTHDHPGHQHRQDIRRAAAHAGPDGGGR